MSIYLQKEKVEIVRQRQNSLPGKSSSSEVKVLKTTGRTPSSTVHLIAKLRESRIPLEEVIILRINIMEESGEEKI